MSTPFPKLWLAALLAGVIGTHNSLAEDNKLRVEGKLPSLERRITWLNSQPLSNADLHGKVVLVQFWTYTCINWRRTLPYVRAWADKCREQGLVVIGVHTPEFSFEKDVDNVRRAAGEEQVTYPIAIDSDYAIWNAFDNRYWPALYFVDAQGRIRHHQFGEGDYEQSEVVIQQLLAEAGHGNSDRRLASVAGDGAEAAADWSSLRSPETYVGYGHGERFASPGGGLPDRARMYVVPAELQLNEWGLAGDWTIGSEFTVVNKAGGKIVYHFHARDVHLVMGPAARGTPVRFRVTVDGVPPGTSHGIDVDATGQGKVDEPRMYQLIRQPAPIEDRQFEIEFLDPGARVFVFTFG
jgi:thiol-disulfide isomerase/thioredoxin